MTKLDTRKLLGFRLLASEALSNESLGLKKGNKPGAVGLSLKMGLKTGRKGGAVSLGLKMGRKPVAPALV